ncbi:MAG: hypothetical protein WBG62_05925 [Cyclobacteriaceae bacterium]
MITRKIIVVDPLPNVAGSVKKTLEGISDNQLLINYSGKADSLSDLMHSLRSVVREGGHAGLVIPVNNTANHPVLDNYREQSGKPDANVYDLLTFVLTDMKKAYPGMIIPVVIPFLFEFKIEKVWAELESRPELTYTLACLVKHINGVDKTFSRKDIQAAFYRHFLKPEKQNYMMKDYIPAYIQPA